MNELFRYKFLIRSLTLKSIRGRYSNTRLGFIWNILTPLITIMLFYIVFSNVIGREIPNYWQYICVGIFPFTLMVNSLTFGSTTITANPEYVGKVKFPKIILPLSTALFFSICFILEYALAIPLMMILGLECNIIFLLQLVPITVLMICFSFGSMCLLSTINVFFRDLEHLINAFSRLIFWISPVVYKSDMVGEPLESLLYLNPLTPFIRLYQDAIYYSQISESWLWVYAIILSMSVLLIGIAIFKKYEGGFAERI